MQKNYEVKLSCIIFHFTVKKVLKSKKFSVHTKAILKLLALEPESYCHCERQKLRLPFNDSVFDP